MDELNHIATDPEEEKKKLLSQAELSIWLDMYDDIFSDFDSRSYSERALSDDFISEARKMAKEKFNGAISLKLLMPHSLRNNETEDTIIKALHSHFQKTSNQLKQDMLNNRRKGLLLSLTGIAIIITAAYLINLQDHNFVINALRIAMEPAGWFFTWTGLDSLFYSSRNKKPEYNFSSRMAKAEITFWSF